MTQITRGRRPRPDRLGTIDCRPARELLDRVVQHLFQVGLRLQAAADLPGETARERLGEAIDRLDEVIHEIRDYAFTAVETGRGPDWNRPGAS